MHRIEDRRPETADLEGPQSGGSRATGGGHLRTQCGGAATAAVGVFSIAAPAVVGSRVGRRVGETRRTRGRTTPAAVAAAIVLTSGYALVVRGGDASQAVGLALLGAGVPLTLTLSDRIFRELR